MFRMYSSALRLPTSTAFREGCRLGGAGAGAGSPGFRITCRVLFVFAMTIDNNRELVYPATFSQLKITGVKWLPLFLQKVVILSAGKNLFIHCVK